MPQTRSELWWSAFTAALIGRDSDTAARIADASLESFSQRWPQIWEGMQE